MNKALIYLKEEYKFPDEDLEDFLAISIEEGYVEEQYELDNSSGLGSLPNEIVTYIFKIGDRLCRVVYINDNLDEDSICFVEEKERMVKYYVPIKD
jgi:hypothetical protein